MRLVGDVLLELCASAQSEVLIVAPFVKRITMAQLLEAIPVRVQSICCVTRWRPEEILTGVSDLDVLDLIEQRSGSKLFVHPYLHAKYFRVDERALTGSANVTQRAMGWAMPANLEVLVPTIRLYEFERRLFESSIEADRSLRSSIQSAADVLAREGVGLVSEEVEKPDPRIGSAAEIWLPLCTRPELLYEIYASIRTDKIVSWTLEAGQLDLRALLIPAGLSQSLFKKFVAAALRQMPLVQKIDEWTATPLSPDKGRTLIEEEVAKEYLVYSSQDHWETLRAWLVFFLPNVFRMRSGSGDLIKGQIIGHTNNG